MPDQRHAGTIRGTGMSRGGAQAHDYAWRGEPEPPEVTAARERHRALNAALAERLRELEAAQSRAGDDDDDD